MADAAPTPQQLKGALKAFKKRLKLTQLDAESKIAGGPLTSGRGSGIVAIMPPIEYPPEVWEELAKQGKLKRAGGGTYELVPDYLSGQ
jgi:hypothetical protein